MISGNFITNSMFRISPEMKSKNSKHPLLSSFYIISAGTMDGLHTKGKRVDRYFDSEFIMLYCIEGKGWTQAITGEAIELHTGDILFCFDQSVQKYWADEENPWTIGWVRFHGAEALPLLESCNVTHEKPILSIGYHEKILLLMKEILLVMEKGLTFHHIMHASNCMRYILSSLSVLQTNEHDEPTISRMIDYMKKNIDSSFRLDQAAGKFGISKDYFIRYFKKQTGFTPIQYFIDLKIQKACYYITATEQSVIEIANRLGFEEACYFSRLFKKKTGYTPSEYRKIYRYL